MASAAVRDDAHARRQATSGRSRARSRIAAATCARRKACEWESLTRPAHGEQQQDDLRDAVEIEDGVHLVVVKPVERDDAETERVRDEIQVLADVTSFE